MNLLTHQASRDDPGSEPANIGGRGHLEADEDVLHRRDGE
eukprot:COSAG04_NODE_30649_length_261_cov_0.950617_1_plen_39_part_10